MMLLMSLSTDESHSAKVSAVTHDLRRTLGRRLREHRESLGVSQEALADQLGYHRTYLGAVERGERNLTLDTLEHLADRLGVDPLDLLRP